MSTAATRVRPRRAQRAEREASSIARDSRGKSAPRPVREAPEPSWTPPGFERTLRGELGAGAAVPALMREEIRPSLGGAVERARLHAGTSADRLNARLGALAFTHGDDIVMSSVIAPLRTPFQHTVLAHELVHVEQQHGGAPVVQTYLDPRVARLEESAMTAQSADDLARMEREVIAELRAPTQRNRADSEWNLAIIQAELVRKGRPITPFTGLRFAVSPNDRATLDQVLALQTRIDVIAGLANTLFPGMVATLQTRLTQWRTDVENLHKDAVFDEGEKLVAIQGALEATSRIKTGTPEAPAQDPAVATAQTAVFQAIDNLLRDLGTAAQGARITALTRASEQYADAFSAAMISAVQRAKELIAGADSAPPGSGDIFINGYAQNGRIVVGGSMNELGTYTFARERLQRDLNRLGDLNRLRTAPYAERAAFMEREGRNLGKLINRAQGIALMRGAFSAGSVLLDAVTRQTYQIVAGDALDAGDLRASVVVPLAAGLETADGPSEGVLRAAQSRLGLLETKIRARITDVQEYQRRVGTFVQFATLVLSMYGGMAMARIAAGPIAPGATMTAGQLVRSSLAFTSTSMLITAGLDPNFRPTPGQQVQQYATDLATFGLMHGMGMGLAGRYGGAANVPVGVRLTAEIATLWAWSTSLGLIQHLDQGGTLTGRAAAKIATDAAHHTALGFMAMHLAHHMGNLPTIRPGDLPDAATRARRQAALAEFERVRNEGRACDRELRRWVERGEAAGEIDPILGRSERFYGAYRKAVRGLAESGVIESAQADAVLAELRGPQVAQNIRTAARLGLRTSGEHTVAYSADVRNVDMFLRQLQRQGQVLSFEPTGRTGIYRVRQSDGSWALWFPEGPAPQHAHGFDLPAKVLAEAYPTLPPEVRARALANLSRLPPAEANRVLATMNGAEGEALVRWMARGDVGVSRFLTGDMLSAFLVDPALRTTLTTESPDVIQRWHDVPFEQVVGDRSGAAFVRFLAQVRAYNGSLRVASRAEALRIAGELVRTAEPMRFDPQTTFRPSEWVPRGGSASPKSARLQIAEIVRQHGLTGDFHEINHGGLTYVFSVEGGGVGTVYVFRGTRFQRLVNVADKVTALREGLRNADAISDPVARQQAIDALAPLANDILFLRDVRGIPVGDVVPLINRVRPRAATPLPDVLPPDPVSPNTPRSEVPITRAEAARQRRQQLLERAQRMGESDDPMVAQLREWNPDLPDQGRRVANPDALMSGIETYLDALRDRRLGRVLRPPRGCFIGSTAVWLDRGERIDISALDGDARVIAIDGEGGERRAAITGRTRFIAPRTLIVRLSDGSELTTTPEHPLWVAGRGWRAADQLASGDVLLARRGEIAVTDVAAGGPCEVWNLEVAGTHTFLVGDAGVLVHNKAMPAVSAQHGVLPAGAEYTYRNGGTGALEKDLDATGARVVKTWDPATGLRTLTLLQDGQPPVVLRERGRYADVRIELATLDPVDQGRINNLFARYGITDPVIQGRILEAIEASRITSGGRPTQDVNSALGRVRPLLEEAKAEGAGRNPPVSTQDVLTGRGSQPIADAASSALIPAAEQAIAQGILTDPRFLAARTEAEIREILTENMQADLAAERATAVHGQSRGRVVRNVRFKGNLYDTATTDVMRRANTDVIPDLDLAYIVENGGVYEIRYGAQTKIGGGGNVGGAARQNRRVQNALTATGRFEDVTNAGVHVWVEVTGIEAVEMNGTTLPLTGRVRLALPAGASLETIGAHGARGGYSATLPSEANRGRLDRIANLIWRMREIRARPELTP